MNEVTQFALGNFTPEVTDNTEISTVKGISRNDNFRDPCGSSCLGSIVVSFTAFFMIVVIAM